MLEGSEAPGSLVVVLQEQSVDTHAPKQAPGDRFVATGKEPAAALIAEELGVEVAKPNGQPLDAPLDTCTDVAWVGYANRSIRQLVEPALQACLRRRELLDEENG